MEWPRAIPNYPIGHHRIVSEVRNFEIEQPGLFFLGNWLKGISLNDRVVQANSQANRVVNFLQRNEAPVSRLVGNF